MKEEKIASLWSHLHGLIMLEKQGSFTLAAERLGISKAAMSQRIADLERAAGVSLVRRTTRSVRLTEAGEQLVADTHEAFDAISQGFSKVRDRAETPRGLLRVTAPVAFCRQQLIPKLPRFLSQYPEVRLEIDMSDRLRSLDVEGFDVSIRHAASVPQTHVAWKIADTRSVLVASKAYLRRMGTPRHPGDLVDHQCLLYPRPHAIAAWSFCPRPGAGHSGSTRAPVRAAKTSARERLTVPISGALAVNNSEALRDAAISGLGIALVPDFSAQAALQGGKLIALFPGWQTVDAFGEQLFAIRPYSNHVPQVVSVFVRYLRDAFGEGFAA